MKPSLTPMLLAALLIGIAPGMVFSQKESACTITINPAPNPVYVGQPATFGVQSAFTLDFCTRTFSPNATPQNITVPGPFSAVVGVRANNNPTTKTTGIW